MNRIDKAFKAGKVFAVYLTGGDGSQDEQLEQVKALIEGGVTLLEIGVPFSDPIADGPVIQRAMQRALQRGTTVYDVLNVIKAIRLFSDIPIILFTYYNPVISMKEDLYTLAQAAGVDGMLVIDLPFFEASHHLKRCVQTGISPIPVVSPSTHSDRLNTLSQQGKGFIYYACQKGTTGARSALPVDTQTQIQRIKALTELPILVGFGIADRASAEAATEFADGYVVGSYFIQAIESGVSMDELRSRAQDLKTK